jgi:hypothetical protein
MNTNAQAGGSTHLLSSIMGIDEKGKICVTWGRQRVAA